MNFEYLDSAPDGHTMTMLAKKLKALGIPVFERRWRTHDGIDGFDEYVPEWADRVWARLSVDYGSRVADMAMSNLAKLDAETLNAMLTVFDLGGADVFTKHVLGYRLT